jgi:hypothetical protein
MHRKALHAGQAALALALTSRTTGTHSASDCAATRAGCLSFVGAGTFLVGAYLGSSFRLNFPTDSARTLEPAPLLSARTTRPR